MQSMSSQVGVRAWGRHGGNSSMVRPGRDGLSLCAIDSLGQTWRLGERCGERVYRSSSQEEPST